MELNGLVLIIKKSNITKVLEKGKYLLGSDISDIQFKQGFNQANTTIQIGNYNNEYVGLNCPIEKGYGNISACDNVYLRLSDLVKIIEKQSSEYILFEFSANSIQFKEVNSNTLGIEEKKKEIEEKKNTIAVLNGYRGYTEIEKVLAGEILFINREIECIEKEIERLNKLIVLENNGDE